MELVEAMMEPVEVLVELVEAMKEPLEVLWNSWMQRQLHTRRYRRLAVRPRMQRLRKIVVSRTGQEKQHERVCSSGFSWNRQMRRPLQKRRYGSLAVCLRLQRLRTIVVSRIRESKQHEHVSSPG